MWGQIFRSLLSCAVWVLAFRSASRADELLQGQETGRKLCGWISMGRRVGGTDSQEDGDEPKTPKDTGQVEDENA